MICGGKEINQIRDLWAAAQERRCVGHLGHSRAYIETVWRNAYRRNPVIDYKEIDYYVRMIGSIQRATVTDPLRHHGRPAILEPKKSQDP